MKLCCHHHSIIVVTMIVNSIFLFLLIIFINKQMFSQLNIVVEYQAAVLPSIDLSLSCLVVTEITTLDLGHNLPHLLGVGQLSRLQAVSLHDGVIEVHHEGDARRHRPGTEFWEILSYGMLNTWNIVQF